MLDLGDELRGARLAAGLTQEELAFRSRLSRNYISLLELGSKSPTAHTLDRICHALGVKVSTLIAKAEKRKDGQSREQS
jgi:transcriptional regulator with XRE-family HTH domain